MNNPEIPSWLARADFFRFNMPYEEEKYPWLSFLLDAYALIDASVEEAINRHKEDGKTVACKMGCSHCCSQIVPITPAEAMGIRLVVNELLPKAEREPLQLQLKEHDGTIEYKEGQCPFLVDNYCAIYQFRPIACRRYAVFNTACTSKADIENIQEDGLNPDRAALYAALAHTSPIYESIGMTEKGAVLSFDNFKELFVDLREIKW